MTKAVLDLAVAFQRFTVDDVQDVLDDRHDNPPSRRTIRNRLGGLQDVGVLVAWGGGGRTYTRYSLQDQYCQRLPSDE